jgi:5-methylcytosine-specific restriction protein A
MCEVHHRIALGSGHGERRTRLADLAIVCSNCHRVIHRSKPMLTIEALRTKLRTRRGVSQ